MRVPGAIHAGESGASPFGWKGSRTLVTVLSWVVVFGSPVFGSVIRAAAPHVAAHHYLRAFLYALRMLALWVGGLWVLGFGIGVASVLGGMNWGVLH